MGLLDKIFDKDDDKNPKKETGSAASSEARADKPRADFSNVQGSSSSTAADGAAAGGAARTYTVKSGDSLSRIAKRELGDASRWPEIFEANRGTISNPDLIHPGQVLNLPRN